MVFGFLGGGKDPVFSVANALNSDTSAILSKSLHQVPQLKWKSYTNQSEIDAALQNGNITATIEIQQPIATQPAQIIIHAASSGLKNKTSYSIARSRYSTKNGCYCKCSNSRSAS